MTLARKPFKVDQSKRLDKDVRLQILDFSKQIFQIDLELPIIVSRHKTESYNF